MLRIVRYSNQRAKAPPTCSYGRRNRRVADTDDRVSPTARGQGALQRRTAELAVRWFIWLAR